ncbi:DNA/RNA non-specific endonuclease [Streptomyces sp. MNU76]|uniref:DNA/RNA non-specific endonuclease n=1 Tax=Streptomyces sp. MNU76 TaxID=2560026 RepID=UPI001E50DCFF|nr:DNA/RNA non-specific endonuclease [Streptomyces sp. MNU76]MCC9711618.1 DNA/RNA non-specific endonuclease [Streptomyces sp. MNU76]
MKGLPIVVAKKKPTAAKPASEQAERVASIRQFVRTKGQSYLTDPNVTSIGIGYRQKEGETVKELTLQFTVGVKTSQPETLEALGTTVLPGTIEVGGVEVPTDVIERSFTTQFRVVAEAEGPIRKRRLDPIMPGTSIGHVDVSAGTVGCIVFDKNDATPYALSNWHVLHGPEGELGETVVQPGPHDDNRTTLNRLGILKRSHLGVAGDCAVATIEGRQFDRDIFEIGVAPEELGEPELGDKVIKSGRTTGITHGVVRRIDTLAKIDYGEGVGEQTIGCFEIGIDPDNPPADDEVSRGGDSGSVWLFKTANGRPSKVLAGLHFGGETGDSPDEHALACLPNSVFEKLHISLRPPSVEEAELVKGYDPDFLTQRIDVPKLNAAIKGDAVLLDSSEVIPYTHFSLALSRSRCFARWVAWNIDGATLKRLSRTGIKFVKDSRIDDAAQVGNELYEANRLDRGHIARRADLLWGSPAEATRANLDSFIYTNITPQMDDFNQSSRGGVWGRIEEAVFADAEVDDLKVSAFGGPVLQDDDRSFRDVRIPRQYWKVIAFSENGRLKAKAFLLTQNLNQFEALELDEFRVFQVSLSEIEERCHLRFPTALRTADTLSVPESVAERAPLESLADIQWQ